MKSRLMLTLAFIIASLLAAPAFAQDQEPITLRMAWWGSDARHALYNDLLDRYEELNPNVTVERELAGWGGYWDKLATQTATGNAPDLIVMHLSYINEYARRGALLELDPFIESGTIDLSDFSAGARESGEVDDTSYMVTLGLTPRALIYNPSMFDEAGVEPPTLETTWDEFQSKAIAVSDALGEGVYGTMDQGSEGNAILTYFGQRGQGFFDGDQLGFERADLIEWWTMWEELRDAGAIPPAGVSIEVEDATHADSMLAQGQTAMFISPGNQFTLYQQEADDELDLTSIPQGTTPDAVPYNFAGGAFLAISSQTEHPEAVAELINWFVNDPEVAVIYGGEHGPPGSSAMQAVLTPHLEPADQKLYAFHEEIADTMVPQPEQPANGGEVLTAFERAYQELMFDRMTIEEAVDYFFEEADFILN